jgi:hypothetical protein
VDAEGSCGERWGEKEREESGEEVAH